MHKGLKIIHRYNVPDLRLRCHSEMAVLDRPDGKTLLAAATYSNARPTLIIATPEGDVRQLALPGGKRGGGMVQADGQGRIICGANSLFRVDPESGEVETLAENVIPNDGIWGGGVTSKLIVLGSSTPEGMLVIYDSVRGEVIKTFEPLHPEAGYVYHVLEAPDGRVLIMSSLPRPVITLLDQQTLEIEQLLPEALAGLTNGQGGQFIADDIFYLHSGNRAFLLRYPGFELITEVPAPPGVKALPHKNFLLDGRVGVWGVGTCMLYLLDAEARRWEPMLESSVVPVIPDANERCSAIAGLKDGSVCGITDRCTFFRVKPGALRAETRQLEITGPANAWGPWVVHDGEINKAFGSTHVLQRFWEIDLETGAGRDLGDSGPGGGQVNDMLWDPKCRLLIMVSYGSATVLAYDPAASGQFPENPRVAAHIEHNQMRPIQMLREGRKAWIISGADYACLGGALSCYDLDSEKIEVYFNPAGDLAPTRMLLEPAGGLLYLSTTIHGDCQSALTIEKSARLLVFDTAKRKVIQAFAPREGAETLKLLGFDLQGDILYRDADDLWRWRPADDTVELIGTAPSGLREILATPDGKELWATAHQGVGPLILGETCRVQPVMAPELSRQAYNGLCKYLQWDGTRLWFTTGRQVIGADLVNHDSGGA
jgi:hypothetical protein